MYVRRKMTTEQMEKAKKDEKQPDKKKKRKRKPRESWKHFRHDDIELFKLGNVKEQQKSIYSKLQKEKQTVPQKPVTRTRLKSLANANQNNKSLEQICENLQNKVTESVKDDISLTPAQTGKESDNPEKGPLRVFLKQAKDSRQYEIVFNKNTDETTTNSKTLTLEQQSLPSQAVGRHNLPIQITERRKSIAEPLARIINQNPKNSEETINKPTSGPFLDAHKNSNETDQNLITTPLPKEINIKSSNQPNNIPTVLPSLNGIPQTQHQNFDEPCNLSLNKRSPIPTNNNNKTVFWPANQTTPQPTPTLKATAAACPQPSSNIEGEAEKCPPKRQPRKRACATTRAKKQTVTQKEKNTEPNVVVQSPPPPVTFQNGNFFPGPHILPQANNTRLQTNNTLPQTNNTFHKTNNTRLQTSNTLPQANNTFHQTNNTFPQTKNIFPNANNTFPQTNNTLCLPQKQEEINHSRMNIAPQDPQPKINPFEPYYRRLQRPPTKETPAYPFYSTNPFIPPLPPNIQIPYTRSEETTTAEEYRQRRAMEESLRQNPFLAKEVNLQHNIYTLPRPPVPHQNQIEQERMLLNSLDILNNYRALNLNNAAAPSNPINNQPSINLMNSLQDKNNNRLSLFTAPFVHNYPIAQPQISQFATLESTNNNLNNLHHQETPFLLNNNTKGALRVPELFTTHPHPTSINFSTIKDPTPTDVSLLHFLHRHDFSKPPPFSENPPNPSPYSEVTQGNIFSKGPTPPNNFMCGFLTPPSSSLDVLEISEEHNSSRRNVASKPTLSHSSTSTSTDINGPIIDFPTPNEEISQPILKPTRYNSPQSISLSNLPRNSVIKANFRNIPSNQTANSSAPVKTPITDASNPKNEIENNSKPQETKKLKEISTQTDFSVDSISPAVDKVQDEKESIKTIKRKFSEDAKDENFNKLMALSSNPMLTKRDENKIISNRFYENVTPVNFPTGKNISGQNQNQDTDVISKTVPNKTEKTTENVVVILEDSSNEAVVKNEEIILIEDSSDEAENETVEHCPSKIQKSELKLDNKKVESNAKPETVHSENADISNFSNILPPLNDSATLEPEEYISEIKTLEKNETPSEFYDFYLFVTKKQILNNQKPISFKIFLEFQNAGSLKAMEEAYKIYMMKSEKEK